MAWSRTMPWPIVWATAVPKIKTARKLKVAAQYTASRGVSTRVETTVAMAFAASWKPLIKSKTRATPIRTRTRGGAARSWRIPVRLSAAGMSGGLEHDAFDKIGDIFAAIKGVFEEFVNLLPLDDVDRVRALLEKPRHALPEDGIPLVFEPIDFHADLQHVHRILQPTQSAHSLLDLLDSFKEHCPELVRFRCHVLDIIHNDALAGGIDEIQDVIHAGDELMDLVTIERGKKSFMEGFEGAVRNIIPGMLDVFDGLGILGGGMHVAQHVQQCLRPLDTLAGMLLKEIKKTVLLGEQRAKGHRSLLEKMSECSGAHVAASSRLLYLETRVRASAPSMRVADRRSSPSMGLQPPRGLQVFHIAPGNPMT